ncbi:DUF3515 domain-containing protein [Mycobacterium sp. 236(2023)]|uniref:DUF3515 domain-containing protein n=1 Tax=Mycobacterium sp. 236(2023) TaxID=3038163 RepID=UPI002414E9AB|nr:DUF3515 domain-containing protein [Mycobacterium sp. 236(2023)]MDG4664762.1 DUF3515 domain-containing protein [Mycobacterium sp. 236(2023)]
MNSKTGDAPPRAVLIAALVVAVGGVVAVLVVAAVMQRSPAQAPVAVTTIPAPQADSPECRSLVDALPDAVGDYRRAALVDPAPAGAAAWQPQEPGGEPLVLRCGLDRPAEFVVGAPQQVVDDVSWFQVDDPAGDGRATWFAVDRPVYVALTLPPGSGPTPIQTLSTTIADTLAARRPEPAPVG